MLFKFIIINSNLSLTRHGGGRQVLSESYAAGELEVRSYTLYFPMHRNFALYIAVSILTVNSKIRRVVNFTENTTLVHKPCE